MDIKQMGQLQTAHRKLKNLARKATGLFTIFTK